MQFVMQYLIFSTRIRIFLIEMSDCKRSSTSLPYSIASTFRKHGHVIVQKAQPFSSKEGKNTRDKAIMYRNLVVEYVRSQ